MQSKRFMYGGLGLHEEKLIMGHQPSPPLHCSFIVGLRGVRSIVAYCNTIRPCLSTPCNYDHAAFNEPEIILGATLVSFFMDYNMSHLEI